MRGRDEPARAARPYLSVVIPAYNEGARIQQTLERLREYFERQAYRWVVTVVSDGSTDRTNTVVRAFAATSAHFGIDGYSPNRGKGYAVRRGVMTADGDLILITDADLATPIEELEKLVAHIDRVPVAIGSRPRKGSRLERRQPLSRALFGRLSHRLVQLLALPGIHDTQCGFKLFRREAARQIFRCVKLDGYGFDFESLMIARDLGLEVAEVPIRWAHQEGSKFVLWRDGPGALGDLLRLRLMGRRGRLRPRDDG